MPWLSTGVLIFISKVIGNSSSSVIISALSWLIWSGTSGHFLEAMVELPVNEMITMKREREWYLGGELPLSTKLWPSQDYMSSVLWRTFLSYSCGIPIPSRLRNIWPFRLLRAYFSYGISLSSCALILVEFRFLCRVTSETGYCEVNSPDLRIDTSEIAI